MYDKNNCCPPPTPVRFPYNREYSRDVIPFPNMPRVSSLAEAQQALQEIQDVMQYNIDLLWETIKKKEQEIGYMETKLKNYSSKSLAKFRGFYDELPPHSNYKAGEQIGIVNKDTSGVTPINVAYYKCGVSDWEYWFSIPVEVIS
jgi:hypothetical protein